MPEEKLLLLDFYVIDVLTEELGFGCCTLKLHRADIRLMGDLISRTENELLGVRGIGNRWVANIKKALIPYDLCLDMDTTAWRTKTHLKHLVPS